jgi:hypothetical protein
VPSLQLLLRSAVRQPASCKALSKAFWLPIAALAPLKVRPNRQARGKLEMSIRNGAKMGRKRRACTPPPAHV